MFFSTKREIKLDFPNLIFTHMHPYIAFLDDADILEGIDEHGDAVDITW